MREKPTMIAIQSGVGANLQLQAASQDGVTETDSYVDDNVQIGELTDTAFNWLKRIESILRNGLPHDDKDVAGTIAHAHAMTEQALESNDRDWWLK